MELLANGSVASFTGGGQGADAVGDKIIGPVAGAVWQLNADKNTIADKDGTQLVGNFQQVETLQADSVGEDTLASTLADNTWVLASANSGVLNSTVNFSGFDYLTGSDLKDSFIFNFVGSFGKGVDALKGDNTVQLNLVNRVELDWGDKIVNGVKGANKIIGSNSVDSELSLVSAVGLTWTIDRLDGGAISDGSSTFNFDLYKNIKGSKLTDDFRFVNAGRISSSIDGGEGTDSLQGLNRDNAWQLGQTLSITALGDNSAYVTNAIGIERLLGNTAKDTFAVNARVKASISGGEGDDRLVLAAGSQLEGSFNGNGGDNTIESQLSASRWDLSSVVNGVIYNGDEIALRYSSANRLVALPSGDNQLSFANLTADLTWVINGSTNERAAGQVSVVGQSTPASQFSGFNHITGAKGADDLTLAAAIGDINLGEGNNRLTLQTGAKATQVSAGAGSDELRSFAAANLWQMLSATEGKLTTASAEVVSLFTGFEVLTGSGNDRLSGAAAPNKWLLNGPGSGTLNTTLAFTGFGRLQGNGGNDTFEVDAAGGMASIDGGDGDDSLTARNSANTWSFSRNDSGSLRATGEQANYLGFSGIETFTGAVAAADSISLDPQVSQVKLAAGGQAGDELIVNYRDSLNLSSDGSSWLGVSGVKKVTAQPLSPTRSAQLTSTASLASRWVINEDNGGDWTVGVGSTSALTTHFSGFDKLQGSATADEFILSNGRISTLIDGGTALPGAPRNDSLAAENKYTYWTVTGTGAGSLTYFAANNPPVQQFTGIETLIGNGANDEFRLLADGISINIRGGNSTGFDKVIFNGALDITLGQQDVVGVGIAEIEAFEADQTKQNTLRSSSAGGTWTLSGENSGVLVSGSERLSFSNFQNLLGGKGADLFTLDETARVTGQLSGGEGDNTLRLSHNRDLTASLSADGAGDLAGAFAIARFDHINTLAVTALAPNLSATLTAANQPNQWVVTDNAVVLNGLNYTGFTQLNGQEGVDDFVFNGKQTLSIDGKNGSDSLTLNSAQGTLVNWQLTGAAGAVTAGNAGNPVLIAPLFANLERLIGGAGDDAFVLNATGNRYSFFDGGAGNNRLASSAANNQWQLGALTSDASPVIDHLNTAELLRIQTLQGSGSDTLLGSDDNNLWQLARGGQVSLAQSTATGKRSLEASGMGRVQGGKGQDDFVLQETGSGSFARMDGGEVGADSVTGVNTSSVRDSLDARAVSGDVQVNLNEVPASSSLAANQLVVAGIETLQLNSATNNTLYGPTLPNKQAISWQITQAKQGSFAPKQGAHGENTVTFSGVSNLIAGAGEDRFALATADGLGGDLDGGDGTDYLDYSQASLAASQSSFDVVIGDNTRLKNIEGVIGKNTSTMRLVVKGNGSQWLLDDIDGDATTSDGNNDGRVTLANGKSVDFVDFAALVGTQGVDEFKINGGFNGSITTGEGADSLLVSVNPARAQSIKLINDASDSLSLSWQGAAPSGVKETYKQALSGRESISLESLNPALGLQPFAIDFSALASINDRLAVDEMRVQTAFESAGFNRLSLTNNALQLAIDSTDTANPSAAKIGTWFNVENKTNLVLSGQAGDQLSLSGNSQLAGILSIEKFAISAQGEQSLGAGQINFNSVGSIGSEQKAVRIATPVVQFNNLRGDAWVTSSGDIKLASLDGQGKLNLRADGSIGQTQALSYTRDLTLAASGAINLDSADNRLTGGLSFTSANAINLANGLTNLSALSAEQFTYSGQDLTASGPMVVAGTASLTSTGSIEALNAANRIARLQVNAGGSAKLALGLDATLVGAKVGGALQAQANGLEVAGDLAAASIDLNAGVPATGAGQLKVNGLLSAPQIALSAGDIALKTQLQGTDLSLTAKSVSLEKTLDLQGGFTATVDSLQQAAAAAITTKGAFSLAASGALQLDGAISSGRDIDITSGGNLVQSGAWRTEGLAAGGDTKAASVNVVVKSGGSITQQASASTQSAGNISYEAGGTIKLTSLNAKGEVLVNATAGIEDVNGTATNITGSTARLISGGNINGLDLSVDSLVGQFAGSAKTVSLRNDKTLRIDRLVTNTSEAGAVTTISVSKGDVIFNNDASKNPEVASLYAKPDLAKEKTGVVNGNFSTGTLNILAEKGRVKATGSVSSIQPDLVANTVNIFSALGISTPGRPLVIYGSTVLYTGTGLNWKPYNAFGNRFEFTSDNALDLSQLLLAAGDQLIEVEPLEDVNPAVFTDVRNYSADNLSIMLPADQRYEE
ncbi:MAG TPA: hypothetical protein PKC70_01160 [Cellvibrionaceae bacterium]|nr:hypothetical protein [Cellvibrionaceae bacterium]